MPAHPLDLVLLEQRLDPRGALVDDAALVGVDLLDLDRRLPHRDAEVAGMADLVDELGRVQQRLGRNAAAVRCRCRRTSDPSRRRRPSARAGRRGSPRRSRRGRCRRSPGRSRSAPCGRARGPATCACAAAAGAGVAAGLRRGRRSRRWRRCRDGRRLRCRAQRRLERLPPTRPPRRSARPPCCTGTVSPAALWIASSTPAAGDGISASTLSVEISNSGWSRSTFSPTFTSHLVIVPSAIDSPICGITTSVAIATPVAPGGRRFCFLSTATVGDSRSLDRRPRAAVVVFGKGGLCPFRRSRGAQPRTDFTGSGLPASTYPSPRRREPRNTLAAPPLRAQAAARRFRRSADSEGPRASHLASVGVPRRSGRTCLSPAGASCAAARGAPGSEPSGTGEGPRRRSFETGVAARDTGAARRPMARALRGCELATEVRAVPPRTVPACSSTIRPSGRSRVVLEDAQPVLRRQPRQPEPFRLERLQRIEVVAHGPGDRRVRRRRHQVGEEDRPGVPLPPPGRRSSRRTCRHCVPAPSPPGSPARPRRRRRTARRCRRRSAAPSSTRSSSPRRVRSAGGHARPRRDS